jgi:nitroimidazol reductase NimA-like FMN-containing flavoprotein (pyridoxamine 5'-phosphate oxidase superfamily)
MPRSLQQILDESLASAGPAVKATFDREERRLSAEELREFWRETRMFAVSTVSANGSPHIAPVHVALSDDDSLDMAIFEDSVRLKDLRRDPRIAITSWAPDGRIVIVYGRAHEVEGSRREVGRESGRHVLSMRIEVDRAYAMRPSPR